MGSNLVWFGISLISDMQPLNKQKKNVCFIYIGFFFIFAFSSYLYQMYMIRKFNKRMINQFLENNYDHLVSIEQKQSLVATNDKHDVEKNKYKYSTNLSFNNTYSFDEDVHYNNV